ncbi:DUF211 domain-containing protein [Halobacterium litoreum]|uniref:DUF211 domain-containing protein n=1 Tax=Halobacterium litoreum TaxID=2039234 RepID=A0ABD5NC90_9EURY|nr:DUF211 domain-containing protein [Halobacterium litoreum]UHH14220.1 DUF211 domain-containing protein [Halobacterium litoreum]
MPPVKRLVLDLLKPYDPDIVEFASKIAEADGVDGVNAAVVENDRDVQNVKLTAEGADIDPEYVADAIADLGGTVHSVDEVVCGERLVEERRTPQE